MLEQMADPDYYYHVALSQQIVMTGFPETVPQPTDIGWDVLFTDKEYLYHVITALFYRFFGEAGIRSTSLIFFAISSIAMLYHSLKNLGAKLFLLPMLIIFLDTHFLRRMIMVRPQTLAVMLFVFILLGFLTQRKYMILVASFLFALSYHGLQVPSILIVASLFTSFVSKPNHARLALFCGFGLLAGILLHPYFPGNLSFLSQIINIVRDTTDASSLPYGGEIYPWKTSEYLRYSLILGMVFALGMSCVGHLSDSHREEDKSEHANLMFLIASFSLFLAVSFLTPRGREYLVPTGLFLAIQVLRNTPVTATVLMIVMSCGQFFLLKDTYSTLVAQPNDPGLKEMFNAIDTIPASEKAHVLNCNWSHAPYIMYKRPELTFVDLLDPSFLLLANKSLHEARNDMMSGKISDLRFVVHDVFKAKYMLCENTKVNLSFDSDPHFERLYPEVPIAKSTSNLALFKIKETAVMPQFQRDFEYSLPSNREKWTPISATFKTPTQEIPTSFVNFLSHISKDDLTEKSNDEKERIANCVFVRPKDLTAHVGAEFIGLGGGPNIRLWVNDEPVYQNNGEPDREKALDLLVPLAKPLKATDKISAMICPGVVQSYLGFTMSFWTNDQMVQICSEKEPSTQDDTETPINWKFKGLPAKNCLAPFAASLPTVAKTEPEPIKKPKSKKNNH